MVTQVKMAASTTKNYEMDVGMITLELIIKRHLQQSGAENQSHDKIMEDLNKITHVRLDRESLVHLNGLEFFSLNVTHLYLQHNAIERIDLLVECGLVNLIFVTLAANRIKSVENLSSLRQLRFLDLSENQIGTLSCDVFPKSLFILNLTGNPCTETNGHREQMIKALPQLRQLNNENVESEDDDCSDDKRKKKQTDKHKRNSMDDTVTNTTNDILLRSQCRLETMQEDHQKKIMELSQLKSSSMHLFPRRKHEHQT